MKKIIIIFSLVLIALSGFGQLSITKKYITAKEGFISLYGDTLKGFRCIDANCDSAYMVFVNNGDTSLLKIGGSAGGGVTPSDGVMEWDAGNSIYELYTTKAAAISARGSDEVSFYNGNGQDYPDAAGGDEQYLSINAGQIFVPRLTVRDVTSGGNYLEISPLYTQWYGSYLFKSTTDTLATKAYARSQGGGGSTTAANVSLADAPGNWDAADMEAFAAEVKTALNEKADTSGTYASTHRLVKVNADGKLETIQSLSHNTTYDAFQNVKTSSAIFAFNEYNSLTNIYGSDTSKIDIYKNIVDYTTLDRVAGETYEVRSPNPVDGMKRVSGVEVRMDRVAFHGLPVKFKNTSTPGLVTGGYFTIEGEYQDSTSGTGTAKVSAFTAVDASTGDVPSYAAHLTGNVKITGIDSVQSLVVNDSASIKIAFSTPYEITYAASITFNGNNGMNQYCTLTGNVTSATFTNLKKGATYTFEVIQDAGGTNTFDETNLDYKANESADFSTTGDDINLIVIYVDKSDNILYSISTYTP